ncbi:OLC1v1036807C1, partial [Oldenlandia corymbosa var. corymbosa]
MACNISYMLNLFHTSKYVIENGIINTFSNMPDDGLFVEERLSYVELIRKICMTLGWDLAHVKLHLSVIFDSPGGRRVVKIKNDSHVEFMNHVAPMSCLDLYINLEDITHEEREASLENNMDGNFPRGERASTSRNRDEEETHLFAQDDYMKDEDPDYTAPSESEEDHHGLHQIVRWHDAHNCMTPVNDHDHQCVDASLIAGLIRRKVEDNIDYTVASAQKDVKTLLKVDVPYRRVWHERRKAIVAVYGDWTSNFEELSRYIDALKFTNPETVVEWEWKKGEE